MTAKQFNVAITSTMMTRNWNPRPMTWAAFLEHIQKVTRTKETMAEYDALDKSDKHRTDLKNAGGAFFCGQLARPQRKKDNFVNRSMITLDADYADENFKEDVHKVLSNHVYVLYESRSSRPDKLKYRCIIPFEHEMSAFLHEIVARLIASDIGIEYFDKASFEDVRAMYAATASCDQDIDFIINDGRLLGQVDVLPGRGFSPWAPENWPMKKEEAADKRSTPKFRKDGSRVVKGYTDPRMQNGIHGAFNLFFPVDEAIDEYLEHVYEKVDERHYTFIGGTSHGGLYVFNDEFTLAGSHHDSDPAHGSLWSAFNLVKLHLFDELDEDKHKNMSYTQKPSYKAMRHFMENDEEFIYRMQYHEEMQNALKEVKERQESGVILNGQRVEN